MDITDFEYCEFKYIFSPCRMNDTLPIYKNLVEVYFFFILVYLIKT